MPKGKFIFIFLRELKRELFKRLQPDEDTEVRYLIKANDLLRERARYIKKGVGYGKASSDKKGIIYPGRPAIHGGDAERKVAR